MTSISMNSGATSVHANKLAQGAPRRSFAARLAALQARHEGSVEVAGIGGIVLRSAIALLPFGMLATAFATI